MEIYPKETAIESYLRVKKFKYLKSPIITEKTTLKYFRLSLTEMQFCYKLNRDHIEWKKIIPLSDVLRYTTIVSKNDLNLCDYHYAFSLSTKKRPYLLFCKDQETFYSWIKLLELRFNKKDIGSLDNNFNFNCKDGNSLVTKSFMVSDGNKCLSIYRKSNEEDNNVSMNASKIIYKQSREVTNGMNRSKSTNQVAQVKSEQIGRGIGSSINKKISMKEILCDTDRRMENPPIKVKPKDPTPLADIEKTDTSIENILKSKDFADIGMTYQPSKINKPVQGRIPKTMDIFIPQSSAPNEDLLTDWEKSSKETRARKIQNEEGKVENKRWTNDLSQWEKSQIKIEILQPVTIPSTAVTPLTSKEKLLLFEGRHIKKDIDNLQFRIENLHCGIDDGVSNIDRDKNVVVGSIPMKDLNQISFHVEEGYKIIKKSGS